MTKVTDDPLPFLPFTETVDPSNPAAGGQRLFVDTDHLLKMVDSSGTVTTFSTGGGAAIATDALWDAKGDIAAATGANAAAKLTAGANNSMLITDSAQASGLKWSPMGRLPVVQSPWQLYSDAPTNAEALATTGGTLIVPIYVPAPFNYTTLHIWSTDTASARAAEHRLYRYGGSTMDFVTGTDGTFSFTPVAASNRTSAVSGAPVALTPGGYILALRNTSASQTFGVGYVGASATYYNNQTMHATQTLGSALGSTLTTSGWSNGARIHAVRLIAADIFGA